MLAGHIHRRQVLTADLSGRPLAAPVVYPGSIERTSIAERDEPKGYMTLEVAPGGDGGRLRRWIFHPLPTRPMVDVEVAVGGLGRRALAARLRQLFGGLDPDAVVRLRLLGEPRRSARDLLGAAAIRSLAPETMTVTLRVVTLAAGSARRRRP